MMRSGRSFTKLRCLQLSMCWCVPPSVWYALLWHLRHAACLCFVSNMESNDPLIIAALTHLPCIQAMSDRCFYPLSFATFMERKNERTGEYRYVAAGDMLGWEYEDSFQGGTCLELTDCVDTEEVGQPVHLLPHSRLFTAFQRSLSAAQQAVLTRWAAGDFRAGDEQLRAPETPAGLHEDDGYPVGRQPCPRPLVFHCRSLYRKETEAKQSSEQKVEDVDDGRSESDDDE